MSARPYKPKDSPTLIPYLTVKDAKKSIEFYEKAFGFKVEGEPMEMDGKITHVGMRFNDAAIMFAPEGTFGGDCQTPKDSGVKPSFNLYIYCEDVDRLHERAVKAGARSEWPPENMFWGDRMCKLVDPDGYIWNFAKNVGEFDASKIPNNV